MRLAESLIAEFNREAKGTETILGRVPQDKLGWRPHPKSRTIGELAWHIATIPGAVATGLREGKYEVGAARPPALGGSDFVGTFHESADKLRSALNEISDEALLQEKFSFVNNDVPIVSFPKIGFVRTVILNHSIHHRGQLTVYLRLLDIPVPAIYGTSADENAFQRQ